jgi:hypothetical protein
MAGEATCDNCGSVLFGPYCHACGQRAGVHARSVGALIEDAWHSLMHVDGRLWQTLRLLLLRPGELSREFFRGRRARYIPPFRLYLVLSLLFFALSGLDRSITSLSDGHPPAPKVTPEGGNVAGLDDAHCELVETDLPFASQNFMKNLCRRVVADGGAGVARAMRQNVPRMMFAFLPLIALLMRLLYWRPRHYYVEHLVFFLHLHAAMFLAWSGETLAKFAATRLGITGAGAALGLALFVYASWYLYRAMRRYYGQSRGLTIVKLALMSLAYGICLALTFSIVAIVSLLEA